MWYITQYSDARGEESWRSDDAAAAAQFFRSKRNELFGEGGAFLLVLTSPLDDVVSREARGA